MKYFSRQIFTVISIVLVFSMLLGCDNTDKKKKYIKQYKKFFNYTFNDDWTYTSKDETTNSEMWGSSSKTIYTINYTDSNNVKREFSFDTEASFSNQDYGLACSVVNMMEQIIEDDITNIVQKYCKEFKDYCNVDFKSAQYPKTDDCGNYDSSIANSYSKWILNRKKGICLYNVYDFLENEASDEDSSLKIKLTSSDDEYYDELCTYEKEIQKDIINLVGDDIDIDFSIEE